MSAGVSWAKRQRRRRRLTGILLLGFDVKLVIGLDKGHPLLDGASHLTTAEFDVARKPPRKTNIRIRINVNLVRI